MTGWRQRLKGLLASLGIAAILVGLPALLLTVGFGTLPSISSAADLVALLLRRDDGTLALAVLKVAGWIVWAVLAWLIGAEIISAVRGLRPRDLVGLRLPQTAARSLVSTAAALFVALPSPMTAHAAPPSAPPPITATHEPLASVNTAPAAATREAPSDKAASSPTRAVTVARGDSLWSIAEKELGSGRRYVDIVTLNHDLLGPKGDSFLKPGWVLTLPDERTEVPAGPSAYTVEKGDTLSEIALDELGDATAYPAIFEASRHLVQPGGRRLSDPDVIDVGWTLAIPTAAEAPEAVPVTPLPSPVPAPEPRPEVLPQPVEVEAPPETADTAEVVEAGHDQAPAWMLSGLVGAGTVLGGSLWLALRRQRAAQFRARRPGRTVRAPAPELAPVEKTLVTAGAVAAPTVEHLDETLRRLAGRIAETGQAMPRVAAVEIGADRLALHLAAPLELPEPWQPTPDHLHWHIPHHVAPEQLGPLPSGLSAPYPQLVTVGSSDQGSLWLVNLEEYGTLTITGDATYAGDLVRYIAAEIAVNPWSCDVTLECVGLAAEIPSLNPRRVRHHPDDTVVADLIADSVATLDRLADLGSDVTSARAHQTGDELWDSRLLMIAHPHRGTVTDQLLTLITGQPGRTGAAVILLDNDPEPHGDVIEVTTGGRVRLAGGALDLVAVGLTVEEARGCAGLLAQADASEDDAEIPLDAEPADGWRSVSNRAGQLRPELTLPRQGDADEPNDSVLPAPDEEYVAAAATTLEDLAVLAPQVAPAVTKAVEELDPTLDADLAFWRDPNSDLPKLALLGPVTVQVAATGKPDAAAPRLPYLTEMLAYVATRPDGATTVQLADVMNSPDDRVRKNMTTIRQWLGVNPRTGEPHVPDARRMPTATQRGKGAYRIEDLLIDADLFRRLRVRGEARGADGLKDLHDALSLVRGAPFDRLRDMGGAWLSEGDRIKDILTCSIVDVAHLVTTAALHDGDLTRARAAAELAARCAPDDDTPQLDLAAVAAAEGHHHIAEKILREQVRDRSDDEDRTPTQPPPRTSEILRNRDWLPTDKKRRAS